MTNVTTEGCEAVLDSIGNGFIFAVLFIIVCTAGNIFLLVVIKQTPALKGFSRLLLLNDQVMYVVEHIIFLILITLASFKGGNNQLILSMETVEHHAAVLKHAWMSMSLFLLIGISFNLYVAICKRMLYNRIISVKKGYIVIIFTWVVNLPLGLSPFLGGSENDECHDLTYPWLTVLHLMYGAGSLAGNMWFLHRVVKYRRSQGSMSHSTQEKLKLAKLIFILSISNAPIFMALNLVDSFRVSLTSSGRGYVVFVVHFVSRVYTIVRPCYHLVLYKPLWETTKTLLRSRSRHTPNSVTPSVIHVTHR